MRAAHVHDGNRLLAWVAQVLNHVADEHGALGDGTLCRLSVVASIMDSDNWSSPVWMWTLSELTKVTFSSADMFDELCEVDLTKVRKCALLAIEAVMMRLLWKWRLMDGKG